MDTGATLEGAETVGAGLDFAGLDSAGLVSAGLVWPGVEKAGVVSETPGFVELAEHLVQIVDVDVRVTVEIVLEVVTICEVPEVIVAVTGQTVVVV